jgi:hypothetical protein
LVLPVSVETAETSPEVERLATPASVRHQRLFRVPVAMLVALPATAYEVIAPPSEMLTTDDGDKTMAHTFPSGPTARP